MLTNVPVNHRIDMNAFFMVIFGIFLCYTPHKTLLQIKYAIKAKYQKFHITNITPPTHH